MSFRWTSVTILRCGGSGETLIIMGNEAVQEKSGGKSPPPRQKGSRERGTLLGGHQLSNGTPEGSATQDQGRGVSLAENSSMASHGHRRKIRLPSMGTRAASS